MARDYGNLIRRYRDAQDGAERATYADVLSYVDGLRQRQGFGGKSLRKYLTAIKAYYRWLQATGVREDHPCAQLLLKDAVDRRLRLDELYTAERLAAWLAEAVRLTVGDVDLAAGTVHVTGGGKPDSRTLALKASQVLLIDGYVRKERRELRRAAPRGQRSERLLLTNTGKAVGAASLNKLVNAGRSDDEKLRPLLVRQTVIAGLLEAGHDVRVVQAFAGHRTATATEQYRVGGLKELARAVRELHPRG